MRRIQYTAGGMYYIRASVRLPLMMPGLSAFFITINLCLVSGKQ